MKTLIKETPWVSVDQGPPGTFNLDTGFTHGWEQIGAVGSGLFVYRTYIDLAGMSQQEKTMFFAGAGQQDLYTPLLTNQAAGDSMLMADIMCSRSLNNDEITRAVIYGNFGDSDNLGIPGLTFAETIYMRYRQFVVDLDTAAWGHMVTVGDNQLGSLEPTASDRIYCYKVISLSSGAYTRVQVPPSRYILRAEAKTEEEYQYLMRLKRSYELQQEPDVD